MNRSSSNWITLGRILFMLVFIDESGDSGMKLGKGSTSHFVLAAVIFSDDLDAEETSLKIKRFRHKLSRRADHEFKFSKDHKEIICKLLTEIKDCTFQATGLIVDKSKIESHELKNNKSSFYNYFMKELLLKSNSIIKDGRIRIDGQGERKYKQAAKTYFRKQVGSETIKTITFVNSQKDSLIQLADYIAGSIYKTTQTDRNDSDKYLEIIQDRITNIWEFE